VNRIDLPTAHRCAAHNEAVYAWIRRSRPQLVVLHARWSLPFEATRYADTYLPDPRFVQAGSVDRPPRIAEDLMSTVQQLRALGIEVVLLGPIPEAPFNVGSVHRRSLRLGIPMPEGPTRAAVAARSASSWRALEAVAALPGVTLLDPTPLLCGAHHCAVVSNGAPLYDDGSHLLPEAALRMLPLLESVSPAQDGR